MSNEVEHLIRCFEAAFPMLSRDQIVLATTQSVSQWDSLATVTLMALIEEEFRLRIDILDLAEFHSFESIVRYLHDRGVLG